MSKNFNHIFIDFYKEFSDNMGVSLKGVMTDKEEVTVKSLQPYFFTNNVINIHNIKIVDYDDDYLALCEKTDINLKFNFYIQNKLDYLGNKKNCSTKINIAGLASSGKVVLPLNNGQHITSEVFDLKSFDHSLNTGYKNGFKKTKKNTEFKIKQNLNFLSIIENYFLPNCYSKTNYFILGNIKSYTKICNKETNEEVYLLKLSVTGLDLDVCINSCDLFGVPFPGMRFMGNCWLQGKLL
jgi:hypothetical protein